MVETSFTSGRDWLFKLVDAEGNVVWLLDSGQYRRHGLETPVHKGHLDSLDKGSYVDGELAMLNGRSVIIRIHNWG